MNNSAQRPSMLTESLMLCCAEFDFTRCLELRQTLLFASPWLFCKENVDQKEKTNSDTHTQHCTVQGYKKTSYCTQEVMWQICRSNMGVKTLSKSIKSIKQIFHFGKEGHQHNLFNSVAVPSEHNYRSCGSTGSSLL